MKIVEYAESDSDSEGFSLPNGHANRAKKAHELLKDRKKLPMYKGRRAVLEAVFSSKVVVIVGETGSGKSTQLPQLLLDADPKQRIAVTQPRRVAAMSLSHRVAEEMGTTVGEKVGYQVRFQAKLSQETKLRYLTDGMLLREVMLDPLLRKYTTIVIDEAHERTVTTDLLLGILKGVLEKRDLRLVIMSATLDADKFASFFNARILYVEGRTFNVDRFYLRQDPDDVVNTVVQAVEQVNTREPTGDILVFLSGQDEIESSAEQLATRATMRAAGAPKLWVVPLYAALPERLQAKAFVPPPPGSRKVVLATNIAETSLTIPGVRYVIDSGLRKVRVYRSKLGLDSLLPVPVSQASAAQRMGRAGREAPGKCFRLYTEAKYREMQGHTEPEIALVPVSGPVLSLKCAGVDNVDKFPWLEPPNPRSVANALLQLYSLNALDNAGKVTRLGRDMAVLPVEPALAAVLVRAKNQPPELRDAVIDVAACLSVTDLLVNPPVSRRAEVAETRAEKFPAALQHGDLALLKLIYDGYRALVAAGAGRKEAHAWCQEVSISPRAMRSVDQVRAQLRRYLNISDNAREDAAVDFDALIKAFLYGYVTNTAIGLPDRRYQSTLNNQPINIHPSSMLFGRRVPAIMYLEYVFTTKAYARVVSPIELDWLREVAPQMFS